MLRSNQEIKNGKCELAKDNNLNGEGNRWEN